MPFSDCEQYRLKKFIEGVKLNQLPEKTRLAAYNTNKQSITLEDLQHVAQVFQSSNCPKYLELDFSSQEVDSAGVNIIAQALKNNRRCTHLKLDFYDSHIDAKVGEVIAQMLQNCEYFEHLELNLWNNQLGDEGAKAIAHALEKSCHFKRFALNLKCNKIAAEGAKAIAEAVLKRRHSSQLQFNFCNNQLGDEGAEAMAPLMQSPHCPTKIDLSHNSIGLKGVKAIADALEKCRDNTEINLTSNEIGDKGAILLAQALAKKRPDPRYIKLNLSRNKIGNQGVKAIAKMLKDFPFHLTLDFYDNDFSEEGALAIAKRLPEGPPGLKFKLAQNNLGNKGLKALKAAFQVHHEKFRLPALALVQGEWDKQSFIGQLPGDILNQIYVYLGIENHIKDVRSKLDKWNLDDHLRKVPLPVIKHLFTFFKPSELTNVKLTAHRYNELAKKVEAEAETALLSRFDNEVQVIAEELKSVNSGMGRKLYGDFVTDLIAEAKKIIIIKSNIDDEYGYSKLIDVLHRYLTNVYVTIIEDSVIDMFMDKEHMENNILNTGISCAKDIKNHLKTLYPILSKLAKYINDYRDNYCNSILQHHKSPSSRP